jgi:hypothetical protein
MKIHTFPWKDIRGKRGNMLDVEANTFLDLRLGLAVVIIDPVWHRTQ